MLALPPTPTASLDLALRLESLSARLLRMGRECSARFLARRAGLLREHAASLSAPDLAGMA